eukprot:8613622-Alexandrium_andersonii.AAC.1
MTAQGAPRKEGSPSGPAREGQGALQAARLSSPAPGWMLQAAIFMEAYSGCLGSAEVARRPSASSRMLRRQRANSTEDGVQQRGCPETW